MLTTDLTLDEANSALEKRLALLKHPQTPRPVFEFLVHDLNEVLGSAIALFPAEANAVRISAAIKVGDDEAGLPREGTAYSGRRLLEAYLRALGPGEELEARVNQRFVVHLPYTAFTGTHGRGRRAGGEGFETVRVELTEGEADSQPFFKIDTVYARGRHEYAYLLPEEVAALELVKAEDEQFSHLFRDGQKNMQLGQPPSAVAHYLSYRGFRGFSPQTLTIASKKWTTTLRALAATVLVPPRETGLFWQNEHKDQYGRVVRYSLSGFATTLDQGRPALYEMIEEQVENEFVAGPATDILHAAAAVERHRKDPQKNIRTYAGDDIIGRLAEIRTKRAE